MEVELTFGRERGEVEDCWTELGPKVEIQFFDFDPWALGCSYGGYVCVLGSFVWGRCGRK